MQTVQIRCKAAVNLDLANLTPMQGDLKELSQSNFNKLKQSILRHGITFPFFVWQSDGKNYILDGTQRDRVLKIIAARLPMPTAALRLDRRQRPKRSRRENPAHHQPVREDDQ